MIRYAFLNSHELDSVDFFIQLNLELVSLFFLELKNFLSLFEVIEYSLINFLVLDFLLIKELFLKIEFLGLMLDILFDFIEIDFGVDQLSS